MRHAKSDSWIPTLSPPTVVCSVAVIVLILLIFGTNLQRFFTEYLYPNITFQQAERSRTQKREERPNKGAQTIVFDGEVYRTEGRLREAAAVAIAATLSGVASISERRSLRNVADLLNDISKRGLLPPGVKLIEDRQMLVSEYSTIYVRLRLNPFGVEVVSIGRERLDGPALLLRVPDEGQKANESSARYFYSLNLENAKVPEAFVQPSAVLACGWQTDTIKPELLEDASSEHLAAWANQIKQQ